MNEAIKLQISAFVDGELPDNETELLLRRLSQDADLRHQAAQYLSIGRAIRGEIDVVNMSQLRGRIAAALGEDIVAEEVTPERLPGGFTRPIVGVAVAASVAIMALVGLRQIGPVDEVPVRGFEELNAVAIDDGPSYTEPPADQFMSDRPSDMLTLYYVRHGQQSANLGSRLVGLEVREDKLAAPNSSAEPLNTSGEQRPDLPDSGDNEDAEADSGSAQ